MYGECLYFCNKKQSAYMATKISNISFKIDLAMSLDGIAVRGNAGTGHFVNHPSCCKRLVSTLGCCNKH